METVAVNCTTVFAVTDDADKASVVVVVAASCTTMAPLVPARLGDEASAVVMVWLPSVFSVAEKVPVPSVSEELPGSTAAGSVLVKRTGPE